MMQTQEYIRLPGRGTRFEGVRYIVGRKKISSLWLGSDHLLCAEQAHCTEDYRRFYYRDIQALIIRRTARRRTWNIVCLTLTALLLGLGLSMPTFEVRVTFFLVAALLAIIAIVFSAFGPTCVTHLKTAVQTEEIPSLCRLRNAEKALALLRPRILQAQGELSPEQLVSLPAAGVAQEDTIGRTVASPYAEVIKPYKSKAHMLLFWAMVLDGILNGLQIPFHNVAIMFISGLATLAAMGLMIFALIRQYQTDLRNSVRWITWGIAAYLVVGMILGSFIGILVTTGSRAPAQTQFDMMKHLSSLDPLQTPWLLSYLIFETLGSLGFGLAGLVLMPARTEADVPPPPPSMTPPPPPPPQFAMTDLTSSLSEFPAPPVAPPPAPEPPIHPISPLSTSAVPPPPPPPPDLSRSEGV